MRPRMTAAEIGALLDREFPQLHFGGRLYSIRHVSKEGVRVSFAAGEAHVRPGGTVSGPAMMALADLAAYVALLAVIGPVALAVTTSFNINFLRKPKPGSLLADARLLKLGKTLAVSEVSLTAEGSDDLVAHATTTYSIPSNRPKL